MMDLIIACHCAPALAGIKPANIFTCCKKEYPTLKKDLELLNGTKKEYILKYCVSAVNVL